MSLCPRSSMHRSSALQWTWSQNQKICQCDTSHDWLSTTDNVVLYSSLALPRPLLPMLGLYITYCALIATVCSALSLCSTVLLVLYCLYSPVCFVHVVGLVVHPSTTSAVCSAFACMQWPVQCSARRVISHFYSHYSHQLNKKRRAVFAKLYHRIVPLTSILSLDQRIGWHNLQTWE
jgi:hypothetical protein